MSPINLTAEAYTIPFQGHELHARVFRPAAPAIGRIFYLHGGGLVFGEPDDLPLCYVNLFLNAGYELISLDYPLITSTNVKNTIFAMNVRCLRPILFYVSCMY